MKHVVLDPRLGIAIDAPSELEPWAGKLGRREVASMPGIAGLGTALLDANPDHIQLVDAGGNTLWMNEAARSRPNLGALARRHGKRAARYRSTMDAAMLASALADAGVGGSPRFTTSTREPGGLRWWDVRVTQIEPYVAPDRQFLVIARDVTAEHEADAAVAHAATHDVLTGLVRQEQFYDHIAALVAAGKKGFGVVVIDIDHFSEFNCVCGREAGDDVLRAVGAKLSRALGQGEIAARLGGDEFGFVLNAPANNAAGAAKARAQSIVDRLAKAIRGQARPVRLSVSAGLAQFPADGDTPALLCRNAGSALHEAKRDDSVSLIQVDPVLQQLQADRAIMIARAECALASKDILPYYQPKVDLQSGRIVGFEALLRWRSPSGAIGLPGAIWPAFAEPALARRLTEAMLSRVITDMLRWQRRGFLLPVAINVSDGDLCQPDFAQRLIERLLAVGLPPSCLQIEITEMAALGRSADQFAGMLHALDTAGLRIALDDFGTGYASLTHLRHLPVDKIKIDRSFVSNLTRDRGDQVIVEAMLSMARHLGIKVVAEGIEHVSEARFLRDRGCNAGQGWLFSKAVPASQVPALLMAPPMTFDTTPAHDSVGIAVAGTGGAG